MTNSIRAERRLRKKEDVGPRRGRRSVTLTGATDRKLTGRIPNRGAGDTPWQADDRYRSLVNSIDAGFCVVELKFDGSGSPIDYKFIEVNDAFADQTGLRDATGKWMRTLAPEHEQHWFDIYGNVALTGEAIRFVNKADALDHRWYDVHAFRIGPSKAHQVGILFNDITERKNAEQQRQILVEELGHRLKNTMAMVQAIASQTFRGSSDREAVNAFNQRLQALSSVHNMLLNQNWSAANLIDLVRSIAHAHAEPTRFKLSGPEVSLNPNAALSISLLLHELATNAVKHGALRVPEGSVDVNWYELDAAFVLSWAENGGPAVSPPKQRGFGTRLLREGIVGTRKVKKSYSESGFTASFSAPLNLIQKQA
jgi:two-component system CheB/CheR fusion protein